MRPSSSDAVPGGRPAVPTPVRVAVAMLALLAVILLFNAGLTWFGRDVVVDRIVAAQPEASRDQTERDVLRGVVISLLVGLLAAASAWGLIRRRAWGRWAGVVVGLLLGVLVLVFMLSVGGATIFSLLVLVVSVATISSLLARASAEWASPRSRTEP